LVAVDVQQQLRQSLSRMPVTSCYWVAYSGGLDSHVLLRAGQKVIQDTRSGQELKAVHVHHGLHPEASLWEQHCEKVCQGLGVPLRRLHVDARPHAGESPEAAARRARYSALAEVLGKGQVLLTAHHQNDQAETLLLQLLRGSGPRGLAAMPECMRFGAGWLGRPLLALPREALRRYGILHDLRWIEDSSNLDDSYDRNFLRHEILPRIQGRWPAAIRNLARAARHQADAAALMEEQGYTDLQAVRGPTPDTLAVAALRELSETRLRNTLRIWIRALGIPLPGTAQLTQILSTMLATPTDRAPLVRWPGAEVRRYRDLIYALFPLVHHDPAQVFSWRPGETLVLPHGQLRAQAVQGSGLSACLCAPEQVEVRFRQGGERCLAYGHHHSLKKLLQARGIPPWQRDRLPLIYVGGQLAAVAGLTICEPYRARPAEPGWRLCWLATRGEGTPSPASFSPADQGY
jgi:tRNA(Ile)-lysidine synthase